MERPRRQPDFAVHASNGLFVQRHRLAAVAPFAETSSLNLELEIIIRLGADEGIDVWADGIVLRNRGERKGTENGEESELDSHDVPGLWWLPISLNV